MRARDTKGAHGKTLKGSSDVSVTPLYTFCAKLTFYRHSSEKEDIASKQALKHAFSFKIVADMLKGNHV